MNQRKNHEKEANLQTIEMLKVADIVAKPSDMEKCNERNLFLLVMAIKQKWRYKPLFSQIAYGGFWSKAEIQKLWHKVIEAEGKPLCNHGQGKLPTRVHHT